MRTHRWLAGGGCQESTRWRKKYFSRRRFTGQRWSKTGVAIQAQLERSFPPGFRSLVSSAQGRWPAWASSHFSQICLLASNAGRCSGKRDPLTAARDLAFPANSLQNPEGSSNGQRRTSASGQPRFDIRQPVFKCRRDSFADGTPISKTRIHCLNAVHGVSGGAPCANGVHGVPAGVLGGHCVESLPS